MDQDQLKEQLEKEIRALDEFVQQAQAEIVARRARIQLLQELLAPQQEEPTDE